LASEANLRISYYDDGRPMIAYLHLPGRKGVKSARSREVETGYVLDFDTEGVVIGIELLYPDEVTLEAINRILTQYHATPVTPADLAPLKVA
jgi:hypothetical protein